MSFSAYLKQQREQNKWSIKELAERLGFSASYISQLENGARIPSVKQLPILAKAYHLNEDELRKRWTQGKIQKVSLDGNYKFNLKDAGEARAHEAASKLEQTLEEFKKTFTDDHFQMPVLSEMPADDLDARLSEATDFCLLPKTEIEDGHRVFGVRVNGLSLPDAGILSGDFLIMDADAKPKSGDIVVVATPDGLVMTYYHERGEYLELRPETEGFKKTYHLKESRMIGRLVYHIKKY